MAYLPAGFTPEEEKLILDGVREQAIASKRDDTIRGLTIAATVLGFVYTLSRLGVLVSRRKKTVCDV